VIINADDWGYDKYSTDRALESFLAGRITSTSAVVYMADSARAAAIARANSLTTVGLHLNLTAPYQVPVSDTVRERHDQVVRFFASPSAARWIYNPLLHRTVRAVIQDQIAAFHALYECPPDHLDSHHHMHISPNVLLDGGIPPRWPVRRSFTFLPGEKSTANRAARALINAYLAGRHPTTDYFLEIGAFERLSRARNLAAATVELMAHPASTRDYELLMSDRWTEQLAGWRLGGFSDLRPSV
jgi:predicted glycoside hydrolase/deacetylase ChbG (UPF0249 family)